MKKLISLMFVMFVISCGPKQDDSDVVLGTFSVERTFQQMVVNNPNTCGSEHESGETDTQVWTIDEGQDCQGCYTLSATDNQGTQMVIATSQDGHHFIGNGSVSVFQCQWNIKWEMELDYSDSGFTGTQTDTLTMSCAPGSCSDVWNLKGVLE